VRWAARIIPGIGIVVVVAVQDVATHWVREHKDSPVVMGWVGAAGAAMAAVVLLGLMCKPKAEIVKARITGGYPCDGTGAAVFIAGMTAFMGGVFAWGVFAVAIAMGVVPARWDDNAGWLTAFLLGLMVALPAALRERMIRREHRRVLGLCPVCGYDLRGQSTRCPECGTCR
jgi:hypothetical protein